MKERFELAVERLQECVKEQFPVEAYDRYFKEAASFLQVMCAQYTESASGKFDVTKMSMEALEANNRRLYVNVLPEQ